MSKEIIIIDDDEDDIQFMRESVLALEGEYDCKTFLDACKALEYLSKSASSPALIVIDIYMPKMNGPECLKEIRKIRKLHPTLIAVYSSAMPQKDLLLNLKSEGVVFFQKPSSYHDLDKIFKQLIFQAQKNDNNY